MYEMNTENEYVKSTTNNYSCRREDVIKWAKAVNECPVNYEQKYGACTIREIFRGMNTYYITLLNDEIKIFELKGVYCFEL